MTFEFIFSLLLATATREVKGYTHSRRLYDKLLSSSNYNKLVRPVSSVTDKLTVFVGLKLTQILDIDEKNQIMTTSVWLRQEWIDMNLRWEPLDFGNITSIYLPIEELWSPNIVLYNNADGNYEVTLMTKATVSYTGEVIWEPPAIFKSLCRINVEFFPFDQQKCPMKFGSWTYDGDQVDLVLIHEKNKCVNNRRNKIDIAIDLSDFHRSDEWDVMEVPAQRHEGFYKCGLTHYPDVTFYITIRRKTLYYTVNLILPCVGISFLTVLAFYLPSNSLEKISLCTSILLSLSVFILLLADIMPPTSLIVPLLGKYLLFTVILVTLSVVVTVVVLNVHFRCPIAYRVQPWMRIVFLQILPKLLLMKQPEGASKKESFASNISQPNSVNEVDLSKFYQKEKKPIHHDNENKNTIKRKKKQWESANEKPIIPEIRKALRELNEVAKQMKYEDDITRVKEEWKYVALVVDRLFLWIFTTASIIGTCGIICQAPNIYDKRKPIDSVLSRRF